MFNFLLIKTPTKVIKRVFGILNNNIPVGRTDIFQSMVHNIMNPTNHERKVVCRTVNFLDRINIIVANINPQIAHVKLFINAAGNTRFKL